VAAPRVEARWEFVEVATVSAPADQLLGISGPRRAPVRQQRGAAAVPGDGLQLRRHGAGSGWCVAVMMGLGQLLAWAFCEAFIMADAPPSLLLTPKGKQPRAHRGQDGRGERQPDICRGDALELG